MHDFFSDLGVILVISALLSFVAVLFKQPIILAYIVCGVVAGPWGFGWVHDVGFMENISHLGITLLLFLAGLYLHPSKLIEVFKSASLVVGLNSLASLIIGFLIPAAFGFSFIDSFCIGLAMMFSSTILVIKLLPTTRLHHLHMGAVCIGVLILQDLLAIGVMAFIRCLNAPDGAVMSFTLLTLKLIVLIIALLVVEYFVLRRIMAKVDQFHEALFILGLAWCFGIATISERMGLFHETGAFFAGVVLARHNIARFLSEELKPIRDFFLVLFFFALGSNLNIGLIQNLWAPVLILAILFTFARPFLFEKLFILSGEKPGFSKETGLRLGQLSEFGLLIGLVGIQEKIITNEAAQLIQLVVLVTFVISSYRVFNSCPTPIGASPNMMQD